MAQFRLPYTPHTEEPKRPFIMFLSVHPTLPCSGGSLSWRPLEGLSVPCRLLVQNECNLQVMFQKHVNGVATSLHISLKAVWITLVTGFNQQLR